MLHVELKDLSLLGADLSALGFTTLEFAQAHASASTTGLTHEDQVPELEGNAISATGDIWCLGRHRICCDRQHGSVAAVLIFQPGWGQQPSRGPFRDVFIRAKFQAHGQTGSF
jgi:hypothetical protein